MSSPAKLHDVKVSANNYIKAFIPTNPQEINYTKCRHCDEVFLLANVPNEGRFIKVYRTDDSYREHICKDKK